MIMISLNKILAKRPCSGGWETILKAHGKTKADAVEFSLANVLDTNNLPDTIWCLRCLPEYNNLWRKYAVWCARQVQHLMNDERSIKALTVAWDHSNGLATDDELRAAAAAAADAYAADADAAADAAYAAADAAAAYAAYAAYAAADAAAAYAAYAAADAAAAYAAYAAYDARKLQAEKLKQILLAGEWVD